MIQRNHKLIKIIALLLSLTLLSSCKPGCTDPNSLNGQTYDLEANPDSVSGTYNEIWGGEYALKKNTNLRVDGSSVKIKISGAWSAWEQYSNEKDLRNAPTCDLCFKKAGSINNCICEPGQTSQEEPTTVDKIPNASIDCNVAANQNDPNKCTCTTNNGNISDLDTYIITLNNMRKDSYGNTSGDLSEKRLPPDDEMPCKFTAGLGAYVGLYGRDGLTEPIRLYHLYSTDKKCDINENDDGDCINKEGKDVSYYIYESPNNKIFIKDDKSNNNGTDTQPADDEYHKAGEIVKLIIDDQYYSDNFGGYNITFLSGVMIEDSGGLLQYIVLTFERYLFGDINYDTGKMENGALQQLYESLISDSKFSDIITMLLILYVTFIGVGILAGNVEISRKDVSGRIIKIALILLFTTGNGWYWYNEIVVGFFKYGMDTVVSLFINNIDANIGNDSMIKLTAQFDQQKSSANYYSHSTRFSYIDDIIETLISSTRQKQIWGLLLTQMFGFVYIPILYALIFFLVYVMLTAAFLYISSMIQMILALALGPVFILFSLFAKTNDMFKKWISFLSARSFEVIVIFLVIYSFLIIIDAGFNDLFSYRVCVHKMKFLGLFDIEYLRATFGDFLPVEDANGESIFVDEKKRSLTDWVTKIISLTALIYLLKVILGQIPKFGNDLIEISGTDAGSASGSRPTTDINTLADYAMSGVTSVGRKTASTIPRVASEASNLGRGMLRKTGISGKFNILMDAIEDRGIQIPNKGPLTTMRNKKIDAIMGEAKIKGESKGHKGSQLDKYIRSETHKELAKKSLDGSSSFDSRSIDKRLNKKLLKEPLRNKIQEEGKKLRNQKGLYGKELRDELNSRVHGWANKNLSVSSGAVERELHNMRTPFASLGRTLADSQSFISAKDAAKKLGNDVEAQNKYLEFLNKEKANDEASKAGSLYQSARPFEDTRSKIFSSRNISPKVAKSQFLKELDKQKVEDLRKELYKEKAVDDISKSTGLERLGKSALNKAGINTSKGVSIRKRIKIIDNSKYESKIPKENQTNRSLSVNEKGKAPSDKFKAVTNLETNVKQIKDYYIKQLEKYGYKDTIEKQNTLLHEGRPTASQLKNKATQEIKNLRNRVTIINTKLSFNEALDSKDSGKMTEFYREYKNLEGSSEELIDIEVVKFQNKLDLVLTREDSDALKKELGISKEDSKTPREGLVAAKKDLDDLLDKFIEKQLEQLEQLEEKNLDSETTKLEEKKIDSEISYIKYNEKIREDNSLKIQDILSQDSLDSETRKIIESYNESREVDLPRNITPKSREDLDVAIKRQEENLQSKIEKLKQQIESSKDDLKESMEVALISLEENVIDLNSFTEARGLMLDNEDKIDNAQKSIDDQKLLDEIKDLANTNNINRGNDKSNDKDENRGKVSKESIELEKDGAAKFINAIQLLEARKNTRETEIGQLTAERDSLMAKGEARSPSEETRFKEIKRTISTLKSRVASFDKSINDFKDKGRNESGD